MYRESFLGTSQIASAFLIPFLRARLAFVDTPAVTRNRDLNSNGKTENLKDPEVMGPMVD